MRLLLLSLLCSVHCFGQWKKVSDIPDPGRDDAVGFVLNGSMYVGTGMDVGFGCRKDFYRCVSNTTLWTEVESLPGVPRQYAASFATSDAGYVFGGVTGDQQQLSELWKFDGEHWQAAQAIPGLARDKALAIYHQGKAWIFGGRNGKTALNEIWSYSTDKNEWLKEGELPFGPRFDMAGYVQYDRFYLGLGSDSASGVYKDWWSLDPATGKWEQLRDYPGDNTVYAMATSFETRSMVCGGVDVKNGFHQEAWEYLPGSNVWTIADMPVDFKLKGAVMLYMDEAFYLIAGINGNFVRQTGVYRISVEDHHTNPTIGKIEVYPNPASEKLIILKEFENNNRSEIRVYDHSGALVLFKNEVSLPYLLDLQDLPIGVYSVKTLYGNKKFIKN